MSASEGFEIRQMFEYEIHRKLSMRAKSSTSEINLINNAFKFYDINNTGTVGKNEWVKVFGRIGLNGFTEKDLLFLFDIYDINQTGMINYKNFTAYLYDQSTLEPLQKQNDIPNNTSNEIPPQERPPERPVPSQPEMPKMVPQEANMPINQNSSSFTCPTPMRNEVRKYFKSLLEELKYKINIRNGITFYTFASRLKSYEDKLKKTVSFEDFMKGLGDVHVDVDPKLVRDFFSFIDICDENAASTEEILRLLKGSLSEKRKIAIVNQFALIDKERKGFCPIALLKKIFNSNEHPDVKAGRKSQNEIYSEFIYTMDIFTAIKERGDQISFEDFIEYYHGISASIDNDDYFDLMINGVWNQNTNNNMNNNMQQQYQQNNQQMLPHQDMQRNYRQPTPIVQQQNNYRESPLTQNQPQVPNTTPNRRYPNANQIRYNPINNTYIIPNQQQQCSPQQQQCSPQHQQCTTQQQQNIFRQRTPYQPPQQQYEQYQQPQNSNINPQSNQRQLATAALTKLRTILKSRGTKGIFGIQRMFKIFDRNHSKKLEFSEFENLCQTYRINLSNEEINALFAYFDVDHSGKIDYEELLRTIVGVMNEYRINLVKKVFTLLDRTGNNLIEEDDIKGLYNASRHPEVVAGKKTEQEILGEWLDNFESFSEYNENGIKNRKVTLEEFINYYNQISMSIEDDKYFEYMINNCWDMDKRNAYKYGGGYRNDYSGNQRARTGAEIVSNNYRNY